MSAPSVDEYLKQAATVEELKRSNQRLLRQLERAKAKTADLVDATYQAVKDAAVSIEVKPVPAPRFDGRRQRKPEIAILMLSDWQLGKQTADFSSDELAQRVTLYMDKVTRFLEIERADHAVEEARVYMLGDMVEGETVYPGQAHQIDASLYAQVMRATDLMVGIVRRTLGTVKRVRVCSVPGNHGKVGGRTWKDYHPATNADRLAYTFARRLLDAEPRLEWDIAHLERMDGWRYLDTVARFKCFLFHGHQMRGGFAGFPWYSFGRKLLRWHKIYGPFDYAFCGHYHQPISFPLNKILLWASGSPESSNECAGEELGGEERPSQWLVLLHPENGVTTERRVWLD